MTCLIPYSGIFQKGCGRDAPAPEAGAPEKRVLLHHGGFEPCLGRPRCGYIAARTAADNDQVVPGNGHRLSDMAEFVRGLAAQDTPLAEGAASAQVRLSQNATLRSWPISLFSGMIVRSSGRSGKALTITRWSTTSRP